MMKSFVWSELWVLFVCAIIVWFHSYCLLFVVYHVCLVNKDSHLLEIYTVWLSALQMLNICVVVSSCPPQEMCVKEPCCSDDCDSISPTAAGRVGFSSSRWTVSGIFPVQLSSINGFVLLSCYLLQCAIKWMYAYLLDTERCSSSVISALPRKRAH